MYKLNSEDAVAAGLTAWLIFVVVLFLLGTPAVLSILLGLFAGFATGRIIAYTRAEKLDDAPKAEDKPNVIQPVQRFVGRIPVFTKLRPDRASVFRGKPPKRIGR
ncbi:hypothetical protein [Egbenema bharatensis]|uniref:hypothetical protein n=1 Tax=Egbenema bharatensis TaxID=3463334 RepID=UPI003A888E54